MSTHNQPTRPESLDSQAKTASPTSEQVRANAPSYKVRNIDRQHNAAFGGDPSEHDRACVLDMSRSTRHPLTGESQHPAVYFGTLAECWSWVRSRE